MNALESVKNYYGQVLQSKADLKTTACCTAESFPVWMRPLVAKVEAEIQDRFYGCGVPFPAELRGRTVLDLGCGTGRDAYLLSQLVGPEGQVIGVDMTEAQLDVAERHKAAHMKRFGFGTPNVEFKQGYIEDLESIGIDSASVDIVVSNCVFNLSPEKERVFREVWRVLRPGGELYFSDVFVDRRLPAACAKDPVLLGECLGGALYVEDFRRLMQKVGCADVRRVRSSPIEITHDETKAKVANARFGSITYRAFKVPLEDRCEDFGQVATYLGSLEHQKHAWSLDDHHLFESGRPALVCGNTAAMLEQTRFVKHFRIDGDRSQHFGLFECASPTSSGENDAGALACC